jgi:hypothetical protein
MAIGKYLLKSLINLLDDKRLDEWISLDRFDLTKSEELKNHKNDPEFNNTERKLTRNQKRKNDISSNVSLNNLFLIILDFKKEMALIFLYLRLQRYLN